MKGGDISSIVSPERQDGQQDKCKKEDCLKNRSLQDIWFFFCIKKRPQEKDCHDDKLQGNADKLVRYKFQRLVGCEKIPLRPYLRGCPERICRGVCLLGQKQGREKGDKKEHYGKIQHTHKDLFLDKIRIEEIAIRMRFPPVFGPRILLLRR